MKCDSSISCANFKEIQYGQSLRLLCSTLERIDAKGTNNFTRQKTFFHATYLNQILLLFTFLKKYRRSPASSALLSFFLNNNSITILPINKCEKPINCHILNSCSYLNLSLSNIINIINGYNQNLRRKSCKLQS